MFLLLFSLCCSFKKFNLFWENIEEEELGLVNLSLYLNDFVFLRDELKFNESKLN